MAGSDHFAYADEGDLDRDNLRQGDVLERTPDLAAALRGLYPYVFANPDKYPYFVMLTQSCDLVRREGRPPKAAHMTLAAARSIQYLLKQEVFRRQTPQQREAGVCLSETKMGLIQMAERLLSNEEAPYFYLHPVGTPFAEPLVTFLRITFPLRSDTHYEVCLNAKRVQLRPEFQAKLGWLTTLVFGRVGTEDFPPSERSALARDYVNAIDGVIWPSRKALENAARQKQPGVNLKSLTADQIRSLVVELRMTSYREIVAERVIQVARAVLTGTTGEELAELRRSLLADTGFNAAIHD